MKFLTKSKVDLSNEVLRVINGMAETSKTGCRELSELEELMKKMQNTYLLTEKYGWERDVTGRSCFKSLNW